MPPRQPAPASASDRGPGRPSAPLSALARGRHTAYALLASGFLYPDVPRLVRMAASASRLARERGIFTRMAIFPQWMSLLRTFRAMVEQDTEGMQTTYTRLFGLAGAGVCSPYESHYLARDPRRALEAAAVLEREYVAEGLSLNPSTGESPDHIAVELEFMAFLCGREADAWARGGLEDSARALARQRLFLRQHLGRWCPRLAQGLVRAAPGEVYAAVAEVTAAFVHHDADLVALLLQEGLPAAMAEGASG